MDIHIIIFIYFQNMNKELSKFSTEEILRELINREKMDPMFYISEETPTSIILKFFKSW